MAVDEGGELFQVLDEALALAGGGMVGAGERDADFHQHFLRQLDAFLR